ncbi:hypothetical protein O9K51_09218 [Purpureocillium lavendulum]|uniref:Uncharacterized protein n=1 Tax=Purpureocillium lavendulum TaxID=1247861 RepID=A0AB34FHG3_9HYPO|nr:hypothetical protein O9K51_09218 [Purpureocillium lavendulum]
MLWQGTGHTPKDCTRTCTYETPGKEMLQDLRGMQPSPVSSGVVAPTSPQRELPDGSSSLPGHAQIVGAVPLQVMPL